MIEEASIRWIVAWEQTNNITLKLYLTYVVHISLLMAYFVTQWIMPLLLQFYHFISTHCPWKWPLWLNHSNNVIYNISCNYCFGLCYNIKKTMISSFCIAICIWLLHSRTGKVMPKLFGNCHTSKKTSNYETFGNKPYNQLTNGDCC